MSDEAPARTQNTAAAISVASAVVGLLVLPIILAPLAVISGFVAADGKPNWSATFGVVVGFGEIIWMLVQWINAGVFA